MAHDLNAGGYYTASGGKAWWYYVTGSLVAIVAVVYFFMRKDVPHGANPDEMYTQGIKEELYADTLYPVIKIDSTNRVQALRDTALVLEKQTTTLSKNQLKEKEEIRCIDPIINFSCQARGTCLQKEEGAIEIDVRTVKAGIPPYRFSIAPDSGFSETPILSDLKPGKYRLYMMDSKQCIRKLNVEVEVPVINCSK